MTLTRKQRMGMRRDEISLRARGCGKGAAANAKGMRAEQRFLKAWNDTSIYPEWLKKVRPAEPWENHELKTDAVMIKNDGKSVRIQIKSSRISRKRTRMFYQISIVPLTVLRRDSLRRIRIETLEAILQFERHRHPFSVTIEDTRSSRAFV